MNVQVIPSVSTFRITFPSKMRLDQSKHDTARQQSYISMTHFITISVVMGTLNMWRI
jgi:hypothetical protein